MCIANPMLFALSMAQSLERLGMRGGSAITLNSGRAKVLKPVYAIVAKAEWPS